MAVHELRGWQIVARILHGQQDETMFQAVALT